MSRDILQMNGGKLLSQGSGGTDVWDFGWRPAQPGAWEALGMVEHIVNEDVPMIEGNEVFLWEYLRGANGGIHPPKNWQLTGSCVNGGAQNALLTLLGIEIATLPDPESFEYPFTLISYGASRSAIGMNSEGEGSSGDTMAKALATVGVTTIHDPSVPQPHICGPALVYDAAIEYKFSSFRNAPADALARCKQHTIQYGNVRSADEAEAELRRYRPLTWCGDWGGLMQCEYKGEPRVLMNRHATSWSHQQSCDGMLRHPTLGRIFHIMNQWYRPGSDMQVKIVRNQIVQILKTGTAISVHGEPTLGESTGGYWIGEKDMDYQCRTGEVRSLRSLKGFGGKLNPGNI